MNFTDFLNTINLAVDKGILTTGYATNSNSYFNYTAWNGIQISYSLLTNNWEAVSLVTGYSSKGYSLPNAIEQLHLKVETISLFKELGYTDDRLFELIA